MIAALDILSLILELIAGLVLLAAVWLAPRVLDLGVPVCRRGRDDGQDEH